VEKTTHFELEATLAKAQRGEDLEKRRERPRVLDEYFRRRNEVMGVLRRQMEERKNHGSRDTTSPEVA
jgi:hypothetical protein